MAHLKKIKPSLQSCLAFLEQCTHLALTEKVLDFATLLLGLNKGMDLMESPKWQISVSTLKFIKDKQDTL
jgi:hypothetical protein